MESKENRRHAICKSRLAVKCDGCSAMKLQSSVSADPAIENIVIELWCENETVCMALEDRRWASFMPCCPGDDLFYPNGQTGRVMEIVFDGHPSPLIRCVKFIGNDAYDSSFRADALGKTVFLTCLASQATGCDEGNAAQAVLMPATGRSEVTE